MGGGSALEGLPHQKYDYLFTFGHAILHPEVEILTTN